MKDQGFWIKALKKTFLLQIISLPAVDIDAVAPKEMVGHYNPSGDSMLPPSSKKNSHTSGSPANSITKDKSAFTPYQKLVVALLTFLQFTIILDFMILSPLGAVLMPTLQMLPTQFGLVVSAYAFSAGIAGILASGFADRFDRKKFLIFFHTGFVLGTLLCALADTYEFLLVARIVTGLFGGVVGSIVFAITTDLFPMSMRGRVMGCIQTAFAASQVIGIPLALYLTTRFGWHAPFYLIVAVSTLVGFVIMGRMQPIAGHLSLQRDHNAFRHLWHTLSTPRYLQGFATAALLGTGGFMIMPFASAFSVHNLGISLDDLPFVYLMTGLCAMVAGPLVGKFSDKLGPLRLFIAGALLSIVMVLIYTNLGVTSVALVIVVNALLFVGISARMITSQTLLSAVPAPESRGSYMAVNSSVQQVSGGLGAVLAGAIVSTEPNGTLVHFATLGYVVCSATAITILMMVRIQKIIMMAPAPSNTLATNIAPNDSHKKKYTNEVA